MRNAMPVTHANENNGRPAFVKLFRLASLIVVALGCGSLNARAQTPVAKPTERPQAQQTQQPQQPQEPQAQRPKAPVKPNQPATVPAPSAEASAAQKYFTDVELINQNGERMRLYSDVLKNHIVVVNAFFATCQGSCLPMNRNLEKVQAAFKERMGKDLYIVSISVDPTVDTPQSLKEYAKKLNAAPGRLFLTGKKENVDWALYKLGQYVEQREQHTNIFIIGNERTGLWKKAFGLAKPEELVKIVESVLDDKPAATNTTPNGK
ncbi:MAG TPA: SCO family protein [Pyrinomonadaceae bacterium]